MGVGNTDQAPLDRLGPQMEIRHDWDGVKAAATFAGVREAGLGRGEDKSRSPCESFAAGVARVVPSSGKGTGPLCPVTTRGSIVRRSGSSGQLSRSVMSDFATPRTAAPQNSLPFTVSRVCSNSCPMSWWRVCDSLGWRQFLEMDLAVGRKGDLDRAPQHLL